MDKIAFWAVIGLLSAFDLALFGIVLKYWAGPVELMFGLLVTTLVSCLIIGFGRVFWKEEIK